MKKKIFTMGKVYDLGTLGVNEVEKLVQSDLDKVFNAGGVRFRLKEVSGKTLELTFFRKYKVGEIDWLNYDPKLIYNIDANIITGHSFNGFRIPDYWGGVPFGYTFSMPKRELLFFFSFFFVFFLFVCVFCFVFFDVFFFFFFFLV